MMNNLNYMSESLNKVRGDECILWIWILCLSTGTATENEVKTFELVKYNMYRYVSINLFKGNPYS